MKKMSREEGRSYGPVNRGRRARIFYLLRIRHGHVTGGGTSIDSREGRSYGR